MKTVGDFDKLGLNYVNGDCVHSTTGVYDSKGVDLINDCSTSEVRTNFIRIGDDFYAHKNWTIKSFAWRTNTDSSTPSFKGEVEYELRNGEKGVGPITALRFSLIDPNPNPCTKWRPHLDAAKTENPAIKPVFTQAMADAKMVDLIAENVKLKEVIKILIGE